MSKNKNIKSNADKLREEFYKGVAELRELIDKLTKKTDEQIAKTDVEIDKLRESQKQTDELIDKLTKKTDAQIAKTDAEIDKLRESQKQTERLIETLTKKTDAQIAKTDAEIEKVNKMVGELTGGWGKFVEGMVEPSFKKLFEGLGMKILELHPSAKAHYNGETMELDIISVAKINKREDVVILVEAESNLTSNTVVTLEKKINNFLKFFQTYKGKKIIGVVAGIRIGKGVEEFAQKKGFYILGPSGDTMVILNDPEFKPKIWAQNKL